MSDQTLIEAMAREIRTHFATDMAAKTVAAAALAALRETHHLVPKDQEPVGWIKSDGNGGWLIHSPYKTPQTDTPLYALEKRHD